MIDIQDLTTSHARLSQSNLSIMNKHKYVSQSDSRFNKQVLKQFDSFIS